MHVRLKDVNLLKFRERAIKVKLLTPKTSQKLRDKPEVIKLTPKTSQKLHQPYQRKFNMNIFLENILAGFYENKVI